MIRQSLIDLIKKFEGCVLKAYRDVAGILTIGYGHTGKDVTEDLEWTQEQADDQLIKDISVHELGVKALLKVPVTDNQLDALTSFAYNLGLGALAKSTLLFWVNQQEFNKAAKEFDKWVNAGGKKIPDLVKRRAIEKALFLKEDNNEI